MAKSRAPTAMWCHPSDHLTLWVTIMGVRLAHSLPIDRLKGVVAILLLVVGTRMLIGIR